MNQILKVESGKKINLKKGPKKDDSSKPIYVVSTTLLVRANFFGWKKKKVKMMLEFLKR